MFSGLLILDLRLSLIVTEVCPGATTGDPQIFEDQDGCPAEGDSEEEKRKSGCRRSCRPQLLGRGVVLDVVSKRQKALHV